MKKLSLIAALTLSTMLSACGGGGGGGHSFVPPSTIPDVDPSKPGDCSTNPETCLTTQKFSNGEKRIELYQNAENQATTFSGKKMLKAAARNVDEASVTTAYNNMRTFLVEGNLDAATDETLLKSLLLAGFSKGELPTTDLKEWVEINGNQIKNKAQTVWDMYGIEREVSIDNAKFNLVNIDAKQDSYVSFTIDSKGKIQELHVDVDKDSPDSRNMTLNRTGDGIFTRTGQMLVYGVKLESGPEVRLELFETPKDITKLQNMLIAELTDNKDIWNLPDDKFNEAIGKIKALTLGDFNKGITEDNAQPGDAYSEGGVATTTVEYKSYAKDLNDKKGLQYADFGTVKIGSMEGDTPVNETFVFAGGMDAKRISANDLQGKMEFEGTAVAALIHQDETSGERVETTDSYNGTANLTFEDGKEKLETKFADAGWYDVTVASNGNNYNIKFEGTPDKEMYKFNNSSMDNFVGKPEDGDYPYGAVDFGYYGDTKDNPTEAAGYVAYGERFENGASLHAQIGFGAVKK